MKIKQNLMKSRMTGLLVESRTPGRLRLMLALLAAMTLLTLSLQSAEVSAADRATSAQQSATAQLTVTLSSQGMTPASATVSTGIVHLTVQNQSGQDHLTLRVSRASGELVREISLPDKTSEVTTELELKTAGQYQLSESSNSSWRCSLTAQAPPSNGGSLLGTNP